MIDIAGVLYGMASPVFAAFAVDAELSTGTITTTLRVIDDTGRARDTEGNLTVQTIAPGAFARMVELTGLGLAPGDCVEGTLAFNGQAWRVTSFEMFGSPQGESAGEVRFILSAT